MLLHIVSKSRKPLCLSQPKCTASTVFGSFLFFLFIKDLFVFFLPPKAALFMLTILSSVSPPFFICCCCRRLIMEPWLDWRCGSSIGVFLSTRKNVKPPSICWIPPRKFLAPHHPTQLSYISCLTFPQFHFHLLWGHLRPDYFFLNMYVC